MLTRPAFDGMLFADLILALRLKGGIPMSSCVINLSEKQLQWLDAILMDQDKEDALCFLKEIIKEQINGQNLQKCGPKLLDPIPK